MSNNSNLSQIDAVTTSRTLANHRVVAFWHTMVGKKVVMAVTGGVLILFVIAHTLGELKIYFYFPGHYLAATGLAKRFHLNSSFFSGPPKESGRPVLSLPLAC